MYFIYIYICYIYIYVYVYMYSISKSFPMAFSHDIHGRRAPESDLRTPDLTDRCTELGA